MINKGCVVDELTLFKIDSDGNRVDQIKTEYNLGPIKKVLKALGLYRCIDDALTNYAVADFATYISTKYSYASMGIDGSSGTDYTLNDLKSPVMSRVLCTKSFDTSYATNDTAVFTAITTADGDYTLTEFGLHTTATSGYMGARQTSCTWSVVNGETYGMIWRVVVSRG